MLPQFLLGHNALIGVNHRDRNLGGLKRHLTDSDREFLRSAVHAGVAGIVLDNHPVALEAAAFMHDTAPATTIVPMVPYAQEVVDAASKGGLAGVVRDMAVTSLSMGPGRLARVGMRLAFGDLAEAGAHVALGHYLKGFPQGARPVVFLHNAVTDLLAGWQADDAISGFASACRAYGAKPGFVTLNGGIIPHLAKIVGNDAWFMSAVNSHGIQMSPSREAVEAVLKNPQYNVVAMSVLGGGLLRPEVEVPRTLSFPAVKSVVIGTSRIANLKLLLDMMGTPPKELHD